MPYIGGDPNRSALPVETADILDDQITLAKLAGGTDGNIISFDASGNPVAIATGSDGQVLTSAGAGQPPAFEAAAGGGKILQVVIDTGSTQYSTTSSTLQLIADPAVTITPSNSSNKVLILANIVAYGRPGDQCRLDLQRAIASGATTSGLSGETKGVTFVEAAGENVTAGQTLVFLDSPSTTSACTYKMMFANESNSTTTYAGDASAGASIAVMEVDGT